LRKRSKTESVFAFGKNWRECLTNLDEERIRIAEKCILTLLELDNLKGKKLLDVGSGNGLFSLSARRLGAIVSSFDYDPESVACTNYLRTQYFPDDYNWQIQQDSILDDEFVKTLGIFDIVYSWEFCITPEICGKRSKISRSSLNQTVSCML